MRPDKYVLMLALLLTVSGITDAQTNKPLKALSFTYHFIPNSGSGENGSYSFIGLGFSGSAVGGTSAGWTAAGVEFAAGDTLDPTTFASPGECCGFLAIGGTTYPWPDDTGETSVVTNIAGISGKSFQFPVTMSTVGAMWVIQVPAKVISSDGSPLTITYGTCCTTPSTTSRLQVSKGTWTLTFNYFPPTELFPTGSYMLSEGLFVADSHSRKSQ